MPVIRIIKYYYNKLLEKKSINRRVRRGDVIGVSRILYEHYAIYTGDGLVIHYTFNEARSRLEIRKTGIEVFLHDSTTFFILDCEFEKPLKSGPIKYRDIKPRLFSPEETVRRAESRLGEAEYNLLSNNCEHFAVWCKTGISKSYQVEEFLKYVPRIFHKRDVFSQPVLG